MYEETEAACKDHQESKTHGYVGIAQLVVSCRALSIVYMFPSANPGFMPYTHKQEEYLDDNKLF